ncbi:hypothetical protein HUW63_04860 [Myxococcus sp. AM001]|nr:hypothetical protein [Myxococcus sp. AM001]
MSNDFGNDLIWVGDLDEYISIEAINRGNAREEEERRLEAELDEIGDIMLLAGKATSAHVISGMGITPSEWRWATHQAEQTLRDAREWADLERPFVRRLLSLGRVYAVNRYAHWEGVSRASALIATLPLGFRALLDQYLQGEGLRPDPGQRERIRVTLQKADISDGVTAYRRAGAVQSLIHELAQEASPIGPLTLDRQCTRTILSLARLRFSVAEIDIGSFDEIRALKTTYEVARDKERMGSDDYHPIRGKRIRNWRLRHLHSLLYLFPYSIRQALDRGLSAQVDKSKPPARPIAVNELALAHCSILRMRRSTKQRGKGR